MKIKRVKNYYSKKNQITSFLKSWHHWLSLINDNSLPLKNKHLTNVVNLIKNENNYDFDTTIQKCNLFNFKSNNKLYDDMYPYYNGLIELF